MFRDGMCARAPARGRPGPRLVPRLLGCGLLAGMMVAAGGMDSAQAGPLTYDFDDGTLQGWTVVSGDPGNSPLPEAYASVTANNGISPQGGTRFVMCDPAGQRDGAHRPLWIRSPEFRINQAGNLTLYLAGGTSLGGYPGTSGTLPTNASQIPLGADSTLSGLMGVALRDTATGAFVLRAERPGPSDAAWKQIAWDVSALRDDGRTYTLELFDYHSGNGWSHLSLDTVSIPGIRADLVTTTIQGRVMDGTSGVAGVVVTAQPGDLAATTDADGDYTIPDAVAGQSYTLTASALPPGMMVRAAPDAFTALADSNPGKDFVIVAFTLALARDPATGNVVLTWPRLRGVPFEVQWAADLAAGRWTYLGTVTDTAAGDVSSFTDPASDLAGHPLGFYRVCQPAAAEGYVYSSFTGDGEDGLHLLTSTDGKTWATVKNYASLYQQATGLMRDPCICRGGDGRYHLVWTTGWWEDTIGIAHSDDLIHWTPMQRLHVWADYDGPGTEESDGQGWPADLTQPVPRNAKVRNCWAPDLFYDDETGEYVIFWATTIDDPSVFPATWDASRWERMNQRIYYITTKDFATYTPRKFFYAKPDRVVIDACMGKVARGRYRLVIKDELTQRLHTVSPARPFTTWADLPADFWGPMSDPAFTGAGVAPDNTNAEGPSVVRVGGDWLVYCDYWLAGKNGLFSTRDFTTMTRLNDQFAAPVWVRHGTVFKAPRTVIDALNAL